MDCKKAKKWYNTKKMKRNEKMKLIASSSYLPNKIVMNKELSEKLGVTEEFIEKRTGIKQRDLAENETIEEMEMFLVFI